MTEKKGKCKSLFWRRKKRESGVHVRSELVFIFIGIGSYYKKYCYAPSYIFCGRHLLGCKLRQANQDSAAGATEELERIVSQIRGKWKDTRIIIRGDAGFCRDELMSWCERNGVDYVLGMGRTSRLIKRVKKQVRKAWVDHAETKRASRRFRSFRFRTKTSWSRSRRVVCKAEHLERGSNTRFIVTSLGHQEYDRPFNSEVQHPG